MSCYIVSDAHIAFLVNASMPGLLCREGVSLGPGGRAAGGRAEWRHAQERGQILLETNRESFAYRYSHNGEAMATIDATAYVHPKGFEPSDFTPAKVLGAIACYRYQSCEHPGWEESAAHAFVTVLEQECLAQVADREFGWRGLAEHRGGTVSLSSMLG